jgi:RecA/RadA recombinase
MTMPKKKAKEKEVDLTPAFKPKGLPPSNSNIMTKFGFKRARDVKPTQYIRTGRYQIDHARQEPGRIGLKRGGVTIVYGDPGAGKTTEVYQWIGEMQKAGLRVALLDIEDSFEPEWFTTLGGDVDQLIVSEVPEFLDAALQSALEALKSEYFDVLVVDSMHAVGTKKDIERTEKKGEGAIEQAPAMASLAQKITQYLKIAKPDMFKSQAATIIIAHARIDMESGWIMLTGGEHLQHESDMTFRFTRSDAKARVPTVTGSEGSEPIGHVADVYVEKCRARGMHSKFSEYFITGKGFSEAETMLRVILASKHAEKLLTITGNYYAWQTADKQEVKVQGKRQLFDWWTEHPTELANLLKSYDTLTQGSSDGTAQNIDTPAGVSAPAEG